MPFNRFSRATVLLQATTRRLPLVYRRTFLPDAITGRGGVLEEKYPDYPELSEKEDPDMNGGYINPPRIKRQFRDPYGDWWDKQERRNYGEPVHEDHDTLGIFSPYEYTWVKPSTGLFQIGVFVATFLGVCYAAKAVYPDRPSYPREFEGGLERELGGAGAVRVGLGTSDAAGLVLTSYFRLGLPVTKTHKSFWQGGWGIFETGNYYTLRGLGWLIRLYKERQRMMPKDFTSIPCH